MALPLALLAAGLQAAMTAKQNEDAKVQHQRDAITARDQLRQQRLAEMSARYGSPEGARAQRYAMENKAVRDFGAQPAVQDWMPLVNAGMTAANAIYDESQKPSFSAVKPPSGEDIPGKNFSPASNYTPPVDVRTWKPVEAPSGNYFKDAASEFEAKDKLDPTRNGWWNR